MDAHRSGKSEALELLIDLFERAQAGFDNLVSALVSEVLDFSRRSALHVDSHERLVLTFNIVATAIAVLLGLVFAAVLTRSVVRPFSPAVWCGRSMPCAMAPGPSKPAISAATSR